MGKLHLLISRILPRGAHPEAEGASPDNETKDLRGSAQFQTRRGLHLRRGLHKTRQT
jgi:hypothetical protein